MENWSRRTGVVLSLLLWASRLHKHCPGSYWMCTIRCNRVNWVTCRMPQWEWGRQWRQQWRGRRGRQRRRSRSRPWRGWGRREGGWGRERRGPARGPEIEDGPTKGKCQLRGQRNLWKSQKSTFRTPWMRAAAHAMFTPSRCNKEANTIPATAKRFFKTAKKLF